MKVWIASVAACFLWVLAPSSALAAKRVEPSIPVIQQPAAAAARTAPRPAVAAARSTQLAAQNYELAPGDTISVEVFGEPDLSKEYAVGEGGRVSFPLIGEIDVAGMKTLALEKMLVQKLRGGFLVNPRVTVAIRTYRAVYVNGQVKLPGGYPYVPGMTARKAITIAGGFTERASKSRIYVISENAATDAKPRKIKIDGEVKPGDIISVEESFF
jgi:polysaccharide biosynthesis/export protein VpsN